MGAMKDFNLWLEENGYAWWNELTDTLEYDVDINSRCLWEEYMAERATKQELRQGVLFDDDDEQDMLDTQHDMDAIIDDDEDDADWVRGYDDTLPLFDEHGGLTAEAYDMLYEMEQDGGFT
tara:strand:+ start:223 stop:585 length:363 start_codon:yes stop_codon:yes gene_type:complete